MKKDNYIYSCVIKTFGVNTETFELLTQDLVCEDVQIKFEEENLDGRITLSKNCVDNIALEKVRSKISMRLCEYIYADTDVCLNEYLMQRLMDIGAKLAVAESVTAGMLSSALCGVNGASEIFYEGIVTYNSASKVRRLHVPQTVIDKYTAVSKQTTECMLKGILANKEIMYAIATTGYATHSDNLEGTAYIAYGCNSKYFVDDVKFEGTRNEIRAKIVNFAMFKMIKYLEENNRNY